jgi:hypothetical protein
MADCSIDRTMLLDATVELIRSQRNLLPAVLPEHYVPHLTSNVRKVIKDEGTAKVTVRWEPARPDDYAFAEAYDVVATHLYLRRLAIEDTLATEVVAPLDYFVLFRRSRLNEYEALDEYVQPGSDDDQSRGFYET